MQVRYALAFALALALPARAADYSGFWKVNCEDNVGLQIKALQAGMYAISQCRPEGCTKPGRYRPNTRIEGDKMYEVQTATRIRVRYVEGGYSTYLRCTNDPNDLPR